MKTLKGTIGYILGICISTPLFITEHYVPGAICMITGLVILDLIEK